MSFKIALFSDDAQLITKETIIKEAPEGAPKEEAPTGVPEEDIADKRPEEGVLEAPRFIQTLRKQITVREKSTVTVECVVAGSPQPDITWYQVSMGKVKVWNIKGIPEQFWGIPESILSL